MAVFCCLHCFDLWVKGPVSFVTLRICEGGSRPRNVSQMESHQSDSAGLKVCVTFRHCGNYRGTGDVLQGGWSMFGKSVAVNVARNACALPTSNRNLILMTFKYYMNTRKSRSI